MLKSSLHPLCKEVRHREKPLLKCAWRGRSGVGGASGRLPCKASPHPTPQCLPLPQPHFYNHLFAADSSDKVGTTPGEWKLFLLPKFSSSASLCRIKP